MQVAISEQLERELVSQLRQQVSSSNAFSGLVVDFSDLQNFCSELQHRNSILDKEGTMLREENVTLRQDLQEAQKVAEKGFAAEEFEKKAKDLEEQNSITLKEHVKTLEELVKCQSELKQKTSDKEQLEEDIEKSNTQNEELQQKLFDLSNQLALEKDALQEASAELEERLRQKEQALQQVDELSLEKRNLEQRMVELKVEVAEKWKSLNEEQENTEKMKKQLKQLLEEAEAETEIVHVRADAEGGTPHSAPNLGRESSPAAFLSDFFRNRLNRSSGDSNYNVNGSSLIDRLKVTIAEHPTIMSLVPHDQLRELEAHPGTCFGLCFNRNGSFVASCGIDRVVKTWDPDSGYHQNTYTGVQAGINAVSFSEDQALILGASTDKSVQVWDVQTCRSKFTLNGHQEKVWTVCCSPLDSSKAVSGGADRCIKVWDIRRGQISQNIMCASTCHSVAVTQDGTTIVSGHFDGGVRFWDMRTAKQIHELKEVHSQPVTCVVASNKSHQILTLGRDHKLKLIQQLGFNEVKTFEDMKFTIGKEMIRPCFSSDDSYVAAGTQNGKIFIWEVESGNLRRVLGSHDQGVVAVAWSPTGKQLVSADNKGIIKFWE